MPKSGGALRYPGMWHKLVFEVHGKRMITNES